MKPKTHEICWFWVILGEIRFGHIVVPYICKAENICGKSIQCQHRNKSGSIKIRNFQMECIQEVVYAHTVFVISSACLWEMIHTGTENIRVCFVIFLSTSGYFTRWGVSSLQIYKKKGAELENTFEARKRPQKPSRMKAEVLALRNSVAIFLLTPPELGDRTCWSQPLSQTQIPIEIPIEWPMRNCIDSNGDSGFWWCLIFK